MKAVDAKNDPVLQTLVGGLKEALGPRLRSVVLYGSAARGDYHHGTSDLNLILVLESLDPGTLEALARPVRRFVGRGHPVPRLFSPSLIAESADTFPIEFLDIQASRLVVHGEDSFAGVAIDRGCLRLQCEREMDEKMMRLREGYVLGHDDTRALRRLLSDSYPAFAALFRGGLHLLGRPIPSSNLDVVAAFCEAAALERGPFDEVARLRHGEKPAQDLKTIYALYYEQLTRAARMVDRLKT
jgi:predicted nucleotidyltransferase